MKISGKNNKDSYMKSYDLSGKIIYMQMKAITEREYAKMEITRVWREALL